MTNNKKGSIARSGWFNYDDSPSLDKRHIGSLARMGFHSGSPPSSLRGFLPRQEKRHLGAIVRSGWTPSFRAFRGGRFSRSGRAKSQIVG